MLRVQKYRGESKYRDQRGEGWKEGECLRGRLQKEKREEKIKLTKSETLREL